LIASNDAPRQLAGQRLLEDVVKDPAGSGFDKAVCLGRLAEHSHALGRLDDAERHARAVLSLVLSGASGGSGAERVRLAEILLDQDAERHLAEARALLDASPLAEAVFLNLRFRICLLGIRVSQTAGQPDDARNWAEAAIEIASAKHSGFRYHPDVALVNAYMPTLGWLREVLEANPMKRRPRVSPTSDGPGRRIRR
jgi:hypothetical protein